MVDAIVRTLTRLIFTRRHLLEWQTAAQVKADRNLDIGGFYRQMAGGVVVSAIAALLVVTFKPDAGWIAAPFVVLWLAAPWVARQISLPSTVAEPAELSEGDVRTLRLVARRTWLFFETFVGTNEHGLPPDNFQDDPQPTVAHRVPTNIGMYLLATVSARDFGWIGTATWWTASKPRWPRFRDSSDSTGTSTTGTTRSRCSDWSGTCRRSTAAISPAICWPWPTPAG